MFYQYNSDGQRHSGHAVSDDLMQWREVPTIWAPTDEDEHILGRAGSLVDDNGVVTLFYTNGSGSVCAAMSDDDSLTTWCAAAQQPTLAAPPDEYAGQDFRDPYVWRGDEAWYMVLSVGQGANYRAILLYSSDDLQAWDYIETLLMLEEDAAHYERPSFFKLGEKWVLLLNSAAGLDCYVGFFWNRHFIIETQTRLIDAPFCAGHSFKDKQGRRLLLGALQSADEDSSGLSLPLQLMLLDDNTVVVTPAREVLTDALTTHYRHFQRVTRDRLSDIQRSFQSDQLKLVISHADDVPVTIFIDGPLVELFCFPTYQTHNTGQTTTDLTILAEWIKFPVERLSIWEMSIS